MGLAKAGNNMLIVADYGNNRVKAVDALGTVTNLYGVTSSLWLPSPPGLWPGWEDGKVSVPDAVGDVEARLPNGVVFTPNSTVYVTEDYYHLIRTVTDTILPPPPPWPPSAPTSLTAFTNCEEVTLTWSASSGATNYNVKRSTSSGTNYAVIASTSATSYTDTNVLRGATYYYVVSGVNAGGEGPNSTEVSAAPAPPPVPTIVTVVSNYGQVALTWSIVPCPNITYNVKRSPSTNGPYTVITNTAATSYTDTGLLDCTPYYYVVSVLNAGGEGPNSAPVMATTLPRPVPDPQIGYVDFPATASPIYTSVFHPVSSYVAYNDTFIVIKGTPGSSTYYTNYYTTNAAAVADPTTASASIPSDYQDGLYPNQVVPYTVSQVAIGLTIKAMGAKADCSPNSAVVTATFQFVTGNPNINGNNAAQFTISDITANAHLYYTMDGSEPSSTNGVDLGTVASPTNVWTVGFPIYSDTLFKVRAFRDNYQPSAVVSQWFYLSNFFANTISFGFASGEASSDFIGSPGQTFYAPVTLTTLPGTLMYSLQFNLTVTNVGAAPAITPGAYGFQSMLMKPVVPVPTNYPPGFALYTNIPPYMFIANASSPPSPGQIIPYNNTNFINLEFSDTNLNLLGVGWLERYSQTNLYNTLAQDLIQYSMAHDDLFPNPQQPNGVIVGGYSFQIPTNAACGQQYQIQIGRPSATSDGIGAPGSDVYIATNNSIKVVTIPCGAACQAGPSTSWGTAIRSAGSTPVISATPIWTTPTLSRCLNRPSII